MPGSSGIGYRSINLAVLFSTSAATVEESVFHTRYLTFMKFLDDGSFFFVSSRYKICTHHALVRYALAQMQKQDRGGKYICEHITYFLLLYKNKFICFIYHFERYISNDKNIYVEINDYIMCE